MILHKGFESGIISTKCPDKRVYQLICLIDGEIDRYLQLEIECQRRFAPGVNRRRFMTPNAKGDLPNKMD